MKKRLLIKMIPNNTKNIELRDTVKRILHWKSDDQN